MDAYPEEAEALYNRLIEELYFDHPSGELGETKLLLYKCSFAYMCMNYVCNVGNYYPHNDTSHFIGEMQLSKRGQAIYYLMGEESIEWETETGLPDTGIKEEMLYGLLEKYRKHWGVKIKEKYTSEQDLLNLFGGLFGDYSPSGSDVFLKALDFVHSL